MDWTKYLLASLIGGVVYFFLGWLIFGMVLFNLTALPEDISSVVQLPMEEFKMSFMIISCLLWGALLSLILMKWAKVSTFLGGLKVGVIVGVMITLMVGFSMASMYRLQSVNQILINAVGDAVCSGLTGGAIGWFLSRGK